MKQKVDNILMKDIVKNMKIDYCIFNDVVDILEEDLSNHTKANLIIDVVKANIESVIEEVYQEGYYDGEEYAQENYESDELDELRDAMDRIYDIVYNYCQEI